MISITALTFVVSIVLAAPSQGPLAQVSLLPAILILIFIIVIAVLADILAIAATAADETPFHAMASDRVPGAKEAVFIVKQRTKMSSIFGDIVGDVCGTISGAIGASIVLEIAVLFPHFPVAIIATLTLSLIAAITVGCKAATKGFAVKNAKMIIGFAGRVLAIFKRLNPRAST